MKKFFTMLSLLASVALVGCSDDNDILSKDDQGGNGNTKDVGYVAVSIVQPSSVAGRATADGFDNGSTEESAAKEATFIIFNNAGQYMSTQTKTLEVSKPGLDSENPYVERIFGAVLVLNNEGETEAQSEGEIFCVLNPTDEIKYWTPDKTDTGFTDKEKLRQEMGDYISESQFIMSNSTYKTTTSESGAYEKEICGTEFGPSNYGQSADEALKNPVDIYVERVVAKVTTTKATTFTTNKPTVNGKELTIRITGINIANVAKKAYLFKNINHEANKYWPNWGDALVFDKDNNRSYWETVPTLSDSEFDNWNYAAYSAQAGYESEAEGIYNDLTDAKTGTGESEKSALNISAYINPNTSSDQPANLTTPPDKATCVLVTAQLLESTTEGSTTTYKPADLVWLKGSYFNNQDAKELLCDDLALEGYRIETTIPAETEGGQATIEYSNIKPEHIEWRQKWDSDDANKELSVDNLKDYQVVAQLKADFLKDATNSTVVKFASGEKVDGITKYSVNKTLTEDKYFAEVFDRGRCYYYVPIDQTNIFADLTGKTHYYGVVRNHIYELNLTGISGIGTAVFDPGKVIIPQTPKHDQFSYLAARINVLKWKLVTQDIQFEGTTN